MSKTLRQVLWGGLVILCSFSWACSSGGRWQVLNNAGSRAAEQGDTLEAEKEFTAALREAEKFGEYDLRLATSLNNPATLYQDSGKYERAEQLYRRALAIEERTSSPGDPALLDSLSNLAAVREAEAKPAELRTHDERAQGGGGNKSDKSSHAASSRRLPATQNVKATGCQHEQCKKQKETVQFAEKHGPVFAQERTQGQEGGRPDQCSRIDEQDKPRIIQLGSARDNGGAVTRPGSEAAKGQHSTAQAMEPWIYATLCPGPYM